MTCPIQNRARLAVLAAQWCLGNIATLIAGRAWIFRR